MKVKQFSKWFIPCSIISLVIIAFGIVGFFTKGINLGLDFKPGLIEEIRVAPPVATLSYEGPAKITVDLSDGQMDLVISGLGATNETRAYDFNQYATVQALADEVNKSGDVKMTVKNGSFDTTKLFLDSAVSNMLSTNDLYIYPAGTSDITTDDVRAALAGVAGVDVKQLGSGADASYQIRMGATKDSSQEELQSAVNQKLYSKFGKEQVAIIKTDFIGAGMSSSIASKSILMFVCVIVLIWAYAAIRFHWDFALGSVVALIHDVLIMFTFIVWTQMEFTTTVLAAVLTIVGYSINATVVILDRIRYNMKMMPNVKSFNEILNQSLTDTLTRSILTTVTTLFAVVSMFVFTTGSIKDFSLALIVGLISGMYSSIFISSAFISFSRRNWKAEYGVHHSLKRENVGELQLS